MRKRWLGVTSLVAVLALVAAACGDDDVVDTTTTTAPPAETTTTAPAPEEIQYDVGVTEAPCADAVNEGNGCIYLGVITDLSGPFAGFGVPLVNGIEQFWARVNAEGGIGGFDVIISPDDTFNAGYMPDATAEGFELLSDRVLAFAQILGTPLLQAVTQRMIEEQVVVVPATWWSGWGFEQHGGDHILESGAPYCFEGMNGMFFMSQALPEGFTWALVRFAGDYGGDYGNGVRIAASMLGLSDPLFDHLQVSFAAGGGPEEAVGQIVAHQPDLVVYVTGPTEMATIMGGAAGAGVTPAALGASPTFHPALLASEALVPLLEAAYFGTLPYLNWTADTPGHADMRAAADSIGFPPDPGFVAGWSWQYPLLSLLREAVASNDLRRASVLAMASDLAVIDYEGMLPTRSYAGPINETVERSTVVAGVDADTIDGRTLLTEPFVSPIVAEFDLAAPCDL
jgi:ABC-type branched-subunit amino acid transport system substrate-binding protein